MASLNIMLGQRPRIICPGHGQVIDRGIDRINWYMKHRQEREDQVIEALRNGSQTVADTVDLAYHRTLRKNLSYSASRNIQTHLDKLTEEADVTDTRPH